ncbi:MULTISPECIES: DUF4396 domain-containing protein [Thiorhodovibrio]|uniref:DUF4396 domain-containing protein n=1 Tax=Thiorhodovibrio TaxID=61593 RepID=UPI001914A062|nr:MULTISPECIES: DUF4396 domain-containing protein [Thiorhodovibrio]MBK5969123.1 copper oxidase [Thiorhodovibrio winogradskyi]WPL13404.1 hypothetical protein Thiosp_03205 [Thiorhodovibrio litoralis]
MTSLLSYPWILTAWLLLAGASLVTLAVDLRRANPEIAGLMQWVWLLTVAYSGPLGLALYYWSGRKQIPRDDLWRRACRSTAHCYSGCGGGEIAGVLIAAGLLSLGNLWVAGLSFLLAYVAGFALTAGPLIQEGVATRQALRDAFITESASITVMEITAISVDLALAGKATIAEPLFWNSLIISLSLGFAAAYPVNALLIRLGVKQGMHDPRAMAAHAH